MTADHWIQIATIVASSITTITVCILGPFVASRVNHPSPKDEMARPQRIKPWMRFVLTPWFLPLVMTVVNVYALHRDLRPAPLTQRVVLYIATDVAAIVLALVWAIVLIVVNMIIASLDIHLIHNEVIGDIVTELRDMTKDLKKLDGNQT
jgi:hypothetical protein